MSEALDSAITAALTFKVPQKIGWSVRSNNQSWAGNELSGLLARLAQEASGQTTTLSLSLIFELTGNGGTVRSSSGIPPGDS